MFKTIGTAVAVTALVYEVATVAYSFLALGIAVPAEQQCERGALQAVLQMERDPQTADAKFLDVTKTCERSATVIDALVPPGLKP
ncbi:hypothetical protein bAD24_I06490 [Burkholderia sp. AD24]|nr:hypothetical protein bAD24_I06490 [Burkholderia sp. AD24]